MKTKIVVIGIVSVLMLVFFSGLSFGVSVNNSNGDDWDFIVDDDGDTGYKTIQSAVDAASEGDRIFVKSGEYIEYVTISKPGLTIKGEDKQTTIVEGEFDIRGAFDVHDSDGHDITISGFSIISYGLNDGVKIEYSDKNEIFDCDIKAGHIGIHFIAGSQNKIHGCTIQGKSYGIAITGTDNTVYNCDINSCGMGIYICMADNCEIYDCTVSNCVYLAFYTLGDWNKPNKNIKIHDCDISDCKRGIYALETKDSEFYRNDIHHCEVGFYLSGFKTYGNEIYQNNIFYNDNNLEPYFQMEGSNDWHDGEKGNYWEGFTPLIKTSSDGVTYNTWFILPSFRLAVNIDHHPLINPTKNFAPMRPTRITGSDSVKPDSVYGLTLESRDVNGDDFHYVIDWGDGSDPTETGICELDGLRYVSHSYQEKGEYTVFVKAVDTNGLESLPLELTVNVAKGKAKNLNAGFMSLFESFIQRFPLLSKILF